MPRLPKSFYNRDTLLVAREMLGKRLVRIYRGKRLSGFIVETEAYIGEEDDASHASRGRTPRTEVMYGPPGRAYIYFTYGMHYCLNVVTEREGFPAAVLLRGLIPTEGLNLMRSRRVGRSLADGPAKLCQALAIDQRLNGMDLVTSAVLFLEPGVEIDPRQVATAPRIGIRGADARARSRPWRFYVTGFDESLRM